ncbi:DUF3489 domain-containing protein [Minwuia sp. IMCC3060]|jgi:Protein of unknown function (DUF3489)|uniref:DUF3489 domain-containing protein n=1 Tax=Minwuia sp. IMCC3060 TaxID=3040675 RepID=UPI00247A6279|nr:DUF3489 domain-containing protein [Minwuia sp. IMCC3060]
MFHLTDTQLVILSNAAQAEGGFVLPLPNCLTINGGAIASVLSSLLRKGLVEERPLQGKGIASAGLHATGSVQIGACHGQDRVWRSDKDGNRFALAITRAGLDAIGVDADDDEGTSTGEVGAGSPSGSVPDASGAEPPQDADTKHACVGVAETSERAASGRAGGKNTIRPGTRQSLLVDLLRRDGGASLDELVQATGWQQHSVRGAISSIVRKKLGLKVMSEKVEGRGRVYRIIP